MNIRFLSVCSGIEAASTAWKPLGWTPVAFSEIEPFPSSVLASHYPHVPNWGDMTKFEEWPDEPIDLLCGGTPCQSFSVAGLRKGLADPRGNLMLTFGAIAAKYRPRWLVWENVPGVLSSNGGRDFGSFLGLLAELGYGFAYRVLDAQYVRVQSHPRAVPQRRRRVFVVGHSGGLWQRAAAVLFERESLRGHPAPRRQARQVAPTIPARSTAGGGLGTDFDLDGGLIPETVGTLCAADGNGKNGQDAYDGKIFATAHTLRGEGFDASEDGTGRGTPLVPVAFDSRQDPVSSTDVFGALGSSSPQAQAVAFSCKDYGADAGELSPTLRAMGHGASHANASGQVAVVAVQASQSGVRINDTVGTLDANYGSRRHNGVMQAMQVRRLTPRECERLQGFPDGHTAVPHKGKPASDGPRYKALGNSWAINCARWVGERIDAVDRIVG